MTQVWMYCVASSPDPDSVQCVVPWCVDDELIFFGPCKVRMREALRRQYLASGRSHSTITDDVFIVGVNGSNAARERRVVWAGKLSEVMTFAEAFRRLKGERFRELREDEYSPLHVRPVVRGYAHRSAEHGDGHGWVWDLVSDTSGIRRTGRRLTLRAGATAWETFDRDCCMLLENRFFADGQGLELDREAVEILKAAQPQKRSGINSYAVFGLASDGKPDGLRGRYLRIDDPLATRWVDWLDDRSARARQRARHGQAISSRRCRTALPLVRRGRGVC